MREFRAGLAGYGIGGRVFHAPFILSTPGLRLIKIATSRKDEVERLPGVQAVPGIAEILADPGIDLVVISTPTATHYELGLAALEAGKHLVMDKPLALTAREAADLIALAARRRRILTVYHNRRWDGDFLTLERCIEEGQLGKVYLYEARYDRYRIEVKKRWREQPGPGSGTLYDLGPHLIDQALHLFGMPDAVTADVFAQREGCQTVDYFHIALEYGRMRAILSSSMLTPHAGPHFAVHGDAGSFLKYGMDPQEDVLRAGGMPGGPGWGVDDPSLYATVYAVDGRSKKVETLPGCWGSFYAALARHLAGEGPLPVDPCDARDGFVVLEAAIRSADERRTVHLPARRDL